MPKERLQAFSDGVFAIIITIMVLELKAPHEPTLRALRAVAAPFLGYALSFTYVAIYWNNHHHMLQLTDRVSGGILWANNLLLFFLSLVPFATDWMGENEFATEPVALYGVTLLLPALAYYLLQSTIIRLQGPSSPLALAVGGDWKGKISPVLYLTGVALAFVRPAFAEGVYVLVALIWLVPDRRIERAIERSRAS